MNKLANILFALLLFGTIALSYSLVDGNANNVQYPQANYSSYSQN